MPRKQNKRRADGRIAVQVYLGMENGKRTAAPKKKPMKLPCRLNLLCARGLT